MYLGKAECVVLLVYTVGCWDPTCEGAHNSFLPHSGQLSICPKSALPLGPLSNWSKRGIYGNNIGKYPQTLKEGPTGLKGQNRATWGISVAEIDNGYCDIATRVNEHKQLFSVFLLTLLKFQFQRETVLLVSGHIPTSWQESIKNGTVRCTDSSEKGKSPK